ncbi:MAG TPA: cation:proton antiporter, partial [Burkholderiales bacterium]|nr:cation:proton antiporter [Burkholderiales bacterium]
LVAGMAIGPWGLGLIAESDTVLGFAELGVVFLLFLIGLELEPQRLWQLRRAIFGMGTTQVALTAAAVTVICLSMKQSMAVALVAGMAAAMSSTAIALTLLREKNLHATPGGQASFAVLLFQDLAVIPMLLGVAMLGGTQEEFSWLAIGQAVLLIVLVIVGGRLLLRPALRVIAATRLREVFVGFSLLLVVGIAWLMEAAGLSMALGAFLAGVLLADSEYRHELELDIEPFKGLLLGLFFIAVGMSVELGLFVRSPLLIIALALGVVALKMLVLFPLAQVFGYCKPADAGLFAIALSQVGEFAFVLLTAARPAVPVEAMDMMTAVVAASMLTTPVLMLAYERFVIPFLEKTTDRAPDAIEESRPVIVAGFGRFGQIVTRVLRALGIRATIVDHDPGQIDTVRQFGWKAYYGDATRLDLLAAAGAARARLLVLAIDDPVAALATAKRVRQRFPQLAIVARARGRTDAYEYAALGIPAVREVFDSGLEAAAQALQALGYAPDSTRRIVERFRDYDQQNLRDTAPHRHDMKKLIALNEQGRRDIAELLAAEMRSAPDIDEDDAARDEKRRQEKARPEGL